MVSGVDGADIEDFRHLILLDLNFEAFRVLAAAIGDDKIREIFKPHMLHSGIALAMKAKKDLGLVNDDVYTLTTIGNFCGHAIWRFPIGGHVLTVNGIEWTNPGGCVFRDAPPALRRMVCDDTGPGFCAAINPDYEQIVRCADKGDSECGFAFRNKADPSVDWRKRGSRDIAIPKPTFDNELVRWYASAALGELWVYFTQAAMEWMGGEAVPRLKASMELKGREWGTELSRITGKHGSDVDSAFSVVDTYSTIMGQEGGTLHASSDRHETEITICPFSVAPAEIGAQCEAFCNGICEAVSPDFELRFTSMMCAGGQNCHRVIRKKLSARVVMD